MEGQSERTQDDQTGSLNRKLKIAEECGPVVDWKIYTACFPLGHAPGLSALLCVCRSMPSDQLVKDWRRLNCASLLLDYMAHMYMRSLNPNSVVKTKKKRKICMKM